MKNHELLNHINKIENKNIGVLSSKLNIFKIHRWISFFSNNRTYIFPEIQNSNLNEDIASEEVMTHNQSFAMLQNDIQKLEKKILFFTPSLITNIANKGIFNKKNTININFIINQDIDIVKTTFFLSEQLDFNRKELITELQDNGDFIISGDTFYLKYLNRFYKISTTYDTIQSIEYGYDYLNMNFKSNYLTIASIKLKSSEETKNKIHTQALNVFQNLNIINTIEKNILRQTISSIKESSNIDNEILAKFNKVLQY